MATEAWITLEDELEEENDVESVGRAVEEIFELF